jgi:hypothetical protein
MVCVRETESEREKGRERERERKPEVRHKGSESQWPALCTIKPFTAVIKAAIL